MAEEKSKIRFFGEIDLNDSGNPKSEYPAWWHDVHISNLEEEISRDQKMIDLGLIQPDQVPRMKEEIVEKKERLKQIQNSKPDLSGNQLDRCASAYKSLENQIKDMLPTRKETKLGLVNPHEELKRKNERHVTIHPEIAKACGVSAVGGKIRGKDAIKCYQILGKALGENTNAERVRKDGGVESYKTMHDFTQAILGAMQAGQGLKGT